MRQHCQQARFAAGSWRGGESTRSQVHVDQHFTLSGLRHWNVCHTAVLLPVLLGILGHLQKHANSICKILLFSSVEAQMKMESTWKAFCVAGMVGTAQGAHKLIQSAPLKLALLLGALQRSMTSSYYAGLRPMRCCNALVIVRMLRWHVHRSETHFHPSWGYRLEH